MLADGAIRGARAGGRLLLDVDLCALHRGAEASGGFAPGVGGVLSGFAGRILQILSCLDSSLHKKLLALLVPVFGRSLINSMPTLNGVYTVYHCGCKTGIRDAASM